MDFAIRRLMTIVDDRFELADRSIDPLLRKVAIVAVVANPHVGHYVEDLSPLVEGSRAIVSIDGSDELSKLVGRKGEVLDALQELTRLAVHQKTGVRSRLMLDIASWRLRRREELAALGDKVAKRVLESGEREELAPMTPFERKIVHDAVAAISGVHSESEGVEPGRRVVVLVD